MNPEASKELQSRIFDLLDGLLGEEEVARLDAELRGSKEARTLFQQLAALHSALEYQSAPRVENLRAPVIPIERILAIQRKNLVRNSVFAAAAVLMISLVALWLKMAPRYPEKLAEFIVAADSEFILTHAPDGGEAPTGKTLATGSRLLLTKGTLEGMFGSGARFVVEAPCDMTVLAKNRIYLSTGVAWFEVPAKAVGFTVETGQLSIVDLGTKFGVVSLAGSGQEIHVTKGTVEAMTKYPKSTNQKLTLKAGEARGLNAQGNFEKITLRPNRFTKGLPKQVTIVNPSFENDQDPDSEGDFSGGEVSISRGEALSGWTKVGFQKGIASLGWKDITPRALHPFPPDAGRKSHALSLITGSSIMTQTSTPWARLEEGDLLTLTIALGMRNDPMLNWNEGTFFGLTDATAELTTVELSDTVANSGIIPNNPATRTQHGDGSLTDVSFTHTVVASDLERPGNIGILINAEGKGGSRNSENQSFFDHVRLWIRKAAGTEASEP